VCAVASTQSTVVVGGADLKKNSAGTLLVTFLAKQHVLLSEDYYMAILCTKICKYQATTTGINLKNITGIPFSKAQRITYVHIASNNCYMGHGDRSTHYFTGGRYHEYF